MANFAYFLIGAMFGLAAILAASQIYSLSDKLASALTEIQALKETRMQLIGETANAIAERDILRKFLEEFSKRPVVVNIPNEQMDQLVSNSLMRQGSPEYKPN